MGWTTSRGGYIGQGGGLREIERCCLPKHIGSCEGPQTAWVGSEEEGAFLGVYNGGCQIAFNPEVFPLPLLDRATPLEQPWFLFPLEHLRLGRFALLDPYYNAYYYKRGRLGFLAFEDDPIYYGCLWAKRSWVVGAADEELLKREYHGFIDLYPPDKMEQQALSNVRRGYRPCAPTAPEI
jgi:hypothetical protein